VGIKLSTNIHIAFANNQQSLLPTTRQTAAALLVNFVSLKLLQQSYQTKYLEASTQNTLQLRYSMDN
jgi:hypothetical protein